VIIRRCGLDVRTKESLGDAFLCAATLDREIPLHMRLYEQQGSEGGVIGSRFTKPTTGGDPRRVLINLPFLGIDALFGDMDAPIVVICAPPWVQRVSS
jgi:hypothetical protein